MNHNNTKQSSVRNLFNCSLKLSAAVGSLLFPKYVFWKFILPTCQFSERIKKISSRWLLNFRFHEHFEGLFWIDVWNFPFSFSKLTKFGRDPRPSFLIVGFPNSLCLGERKRYEANRYSGVTKHVSGFFEWCSSMVGLFGTWNILNIIG